MAEEQAPAKKLRFTNNFVTIKATLDDETESFHVHEDIIKERSQYFRTAFDKKWAEGKAREIEMQEDDPEIVSGYLEFIYRGSICSAPFSSDSEERNRAIQHLIRLYVFGEKIQDDEFCNSTLRTLVTRCSEKDSTGSTWYPTGNSVRTLYDGTPTNSPARCFLVDMHLEHGEEEWLGEDAEHHHPEFLFDLARQLMRTKQQDSYESPMAKVEKWMKKA
ncbi:hypothetical protein PRZ48_013008 [Zasmidium cellare]|uniref:BTB domain-containing protein n=1 Tax=Zasmidium cellare TaxID=395010 RepID=A0ABR0E2V5_ZASCE|nr:hypothetical protein PRZ48_013008 [Zasmidium cellare]